MTGIRDSLTYPHYSKEIIQAILYCKTGGQVAPSTLKVFRNTLLGQKVSSSRKLRKDFDRTDIFIVEIASLLEYKFGDDYYHHIAADLIENLEIRRQSFEELKADIIEIKRLLEPKPVLIATHYSTTNIGLRTELSNFIEATGKELGISTINPSEMNRVWKSVDLHVSEPVVSHFSSIGHEIMSGRYRNSILQIKGGDPIVQFYKPGIVLNDYHGLGDFIYGSLRVHQEARISKRSAFIDISQHPINEFLNTHYKHQHGVVTPIVDERASGLFRTSDLVFTHLRPFYKISREDIDFVNRNAFDANTFFKEAIGEYKGNLGISDCPYAIVHVRLGDEFLQGSNVKSSHNINFRYSPFFSMIDKLRESMVVLVASDSRELLDTLEDSGRKTLRGEIAHLGIEGQSISGIQDTLTQFIVMKESSVIYQISNYSWGSGFSSTASILGNVPLKKLDISQIQ